MRTRSALVGLLGLTVSLTACGEMAVVRVGSVSLSLGLTEVLATGATPVVSDEAFVTIVTAAAGRVTR